MAKLDDSRNSDFNRVGLIMALTFYAVSVVMVVLNTADGNGLMKDDVKRIYIAHWHLEDGYREGIDDAIRQYEALKAKEGVKVRIIQSTVPVRGYQQWFVTQLISGDPADIVGILSGSSQTQNQYLVPLSPYVSEPNPYNLGTPLAGMPWKDTYVDGMNSSLDPIYAEYFGIGTYFHVLRMFVNKELLIKATGSSKMPTTFEEWLEDCRQLREYGRKIGKPIIPIGVRGVDKATLETLFRQYYSQLNGNLGDAPSWFGTSGPSTYELFSRLADGSLERRRLLEAVDLTKELGRNFCDGFSAMDLEQTKFLFFTGNVGFFPEGTWNAWSMVKNSPFEVDVINIPIIGSDNPYYKDFTGETSEMGVGVGGKFGITKASRNFALSLDFLRFLTSYKINQMTMMDYCKWPPAVLKAEYKGLLEKFRPSQGGGRLPLIPPFALDKKSRTKMLETLEQIIVADIPEPGKYFWRQFIANIPYMIDETKDAIGNGERQFFDLEGQRSCTNLGLLRDDLARKTRTGLESRQIMGLENLVDRIRQNYLAGSGLAALEKLKNKSPDEEIK